MADAPRQIVLATHNRDKIFEIQSLLSSLPIQILTLDDFTDMPDVVEDGATLEENARKKAVELHLFTGLPAVADDTGLFVAALQGAPGVYSSRYAGDGATYADNVTKLLDEMKRIPPGQRQATFRTVMAFATGREQVRFLEGACHGSIALAPTGERGFGYDPLFLVSGLTRTFAQMGIEEKNRISHRGRALHAFKNFLENHWLASKA